MNFTSDDPFFHLICRLLFAEDYLLRLTDPVEVSVELPLHVLPLFQLEERPPLLNTLSLLRKLSKQPKIPDHT